MYHRVTGDVPIELDLPFDVFERQMAWLAEQGTVVPYEEAVHDLLEGKGRNRQHYVLTFDDAYSDFYSHALPVLRKYSLPVTLFVPTGYIDCPGKPPISRGFEGAERLLPMTWNQLREVAAEPLVTFGAHTHSHPELTQLTDVQIAGEMEKASERFRQELGFVPRHFAYPRGRWNERVAAAVEPYCDTATIVGGELATAMNTGRYSIPRVPVRRSDGWRWFKARTQGQLLGEERVMAFVRKLKVTGGY